MRALLLSLMLLLVLVAPSSGLGHLSNPLRGPVANAQFGQNCANMTVDQDGGYVAELGLYWAAYTVVSACEDSLGYVTFYYTTVFVMWDGYGNAAISIHMA
jgi:hypothetical protein